MMTLDRDALDLNVTRLERAAVELVAELLTGGFDPDLVLDFVHFPAWPGEDLS